MALKTKHLDIAELLETENDIRNFLNEAAVTGDEGFFIHALSTAARAVGMTEVAKKAGVTRASLYKSLSQDGNPGFVTISKVTKALGCKLAVHFRDSPNNFIRPVAGCWTDSLSRKRIEMSTLQDLLDSIEWYSKTYRRDDLPPLRISKLYDLFPEMGDAHSEVELSWPDKVRYEGDAGVYVFLDKELKLLYIGKASMNNSLGKRLGTYYKNDGDKRCQLKHAWKVGPRYILTIAVPAKMSFVAPAVEEFLVTNLKPTENAVGR